MNTLCDGVFTSELSVSFRDSLPDGSVSLSALLSDIVCTASDHYAAIGLPYDVLFREKQVFVLASLSVAVTRLPRFGEDFSVSTWESRIEPVTLDRKATVRDGTGEELCRAQMKWVIIDPEKRSIIRPKDFTAGEFYIRELPFEELPFRRVRLSDSAEKIETRTVRLSDTDRNGHFHSGRYAAFLQDALYDRYGIKDFSSFTIHYTKEALPGDKIDLYCERKENIFLLSGKVIGENNTRECFSAQMTAKENAE